MPKEFGDKTAGMEADRRTARRAGDRDAEAGVADRSPAHDARRQQREDQLEPAARREGRRRDSQSHRRATLDRVGDRRRPAGAPRRAGRPDRVLDEVPRPRRRAFSDREAKLANGTATTTATFSEPGDYILQAVVDDGSGESAGNFGYHCCWTNAQVKVTVKARSRSTRCRTSVDRAAPITRRRHSRKTSRRFSRRAARPAITRARRRRCRSSPTRKCGRGRARSGSASPTRDMPPWHLDKTVGIRHYKNDRSLSDDEIATVVRWVDAGAPQGNPADMPAPLTFRAEARLVHRRAGSEGHDAERFHDVPRRPGLVDRSVRRGPADRRPLDQVDGDQAEQSEDRPSRRRLCDRAGRAGRNAGRRRDAPRIRGRQIRRHLRRQHRPPAEEGHAAALRHALLRDRLRAAQQDDDRLQVLPEGLHAEVSGAIAEHPKHPERRARGAAEHGRADRRLLPAAATRRASTRSSRTCTCAGAG